jgi:acylphosphatase
MKKCAHIFVHGLVQGVYFRAYTQKKALEFNIKGWVRNRKDGSVEIMAQGSEAQLKHFIYWCHIGSPASQVDYVDHTWVNCEQDFNNFDMKPTL